MLNPKRVVAVALILLVLDLAPASGGGTSTGNVPLNDLGAGMYHGFEGGLYSGGANTPPVGHLQAAMAMAGQIVPRDGTGAADASGWIVMLSIGISNTCHEFAVFERQEDLNLNRHARVILVNGAVGGWSASLIADPLADYWDVVDARLTALNLTPQQVQVVWLKEANSSPPNDFPGHATQLKNDLRTIAQILHDKFPNVRLCYLSTRTYGGYSGGWEPQAYETAFSVKWLIEDQINGDTGLNYDAQAGSVEAPLLLWGPYLWADGLIPRSDGLTWPQSDFESDNVHPSPLGEQKVADLLSQFFASEPTAQPWYAAQPGVSLVTMDAEADAYTQAAASNTNFGSALTLQHQGGASALRTFMRFDTSTNSLPVLFAKLNLRVVTNGLGGAATVVTAADTTWDENTITWANMPPFDPGTVSTIPQSTRDGTIAADVTGVINLDADGVVTLGLTNPDGGLRTYHSREAAQPPRLVMVVAVGPPAPAVSSFGLIAATAALLVVGALLFRCGTAAHRCAGS